MVHIVEGSIGGTYRETNRQLAKENGEIKQLLGELIKENSQRREEIHKCHVRIIELEIIERNYNALRQKYNSIVKIIESPDETLSLARHSNEQQSIILPLPQASDVEECETQRMTPCGLEAISEHGDEEELDQDETLKQTRCHQQTTTRLDSPGQKSRTYSLYDSLEPADVTSVPSLHQDAQAPEQATLSIWKCLDDTNTPNSEKGKDMFQSTPKKPVLVNADSRVNMSPLIRDPEPIVNHNQQQQQHQQRQSQQHLQEEVEEIEKDVKKAEKEAKKTENEVKKVEKEVKKTKRKSKQKEEAAKRPRFYNLRKRN